MQAELYQQMRDIEDRHWWFRARREIISVLLSQMQLSPTNRLLDLGCGTGGNLEMLSRFGAVTGLELDQQAMELAQQRRVANVLSGSLPDAVPYEAESFDCVTMLDVLEHVEKDEAGLRSVHRVLAPGGWLLLTVPAFQFLWGPHDTEHHHYRRYRAAELRRKLQGAGFTISKLSYYNSWLFPPIALLRLVHKAIPFGQAGGEERLPPGWLNHLLERLFASERWVLARSSLPFGVSLVAIAQK